MKGTWVGVIATLVSGMLVLGCGSNNDGEDAETVKVTETQTDGETGSEASQITAEGDVGPVQIDVSTEEDILAALGQPDEADSGTDPSDYTVLTYNCGGDCRDLYYINPSTGKLSDVQISSAELTTEAGTHVGTPQAEAEQLEGATAQPGCVTAIRLPGEGVIAEAHVQNGLVYNLYVASETNAVVTC